MGFWTVSNCKLDFTIAFILPSQSKSIYRKFLESGFGMLHSTNSNMEQLYKNMEFLEYPFRCYRKHLELAHDFTFFLEKSLWSCPCLASKVGSEQFQTCPKSFLQQFPKYRS